MLIAELYFWAQKQKNISRVWISAVAIASGALITLIGVFAAVMMMWTPRIINVLGAI